MMGKFSYPKETNQRIVTEKARRSGKRIGAGFELVTSCGTPRIFGLSF